MQKIMASDMMREAYAPMIELLSAGRDDQNAVVRALMLTIRQALDAEEGGLTPPQSSADLIEAHGPTIELLEADRPVQYDAIAAMKLEIRRQRDIDLIEHRGYIQAPILPSLPSKTAITEATNRLNSEGAGWQKAGQRQQALLVMQGGEAVPYQATASQQQERVRAPLAQKTAA